MRFQYCLNTSTIRPVPLLDKIHFAGKARFRAIELWTDDIDNFLDEGGSITDIRRALDDNGLQVPTVIALHSWLGTSKSEHILALTEARRRMDQAAKIGASGIIASPALEKCDLSRAGEQYRELIDIGINMGVLPAMEFLGFVGSVYTISQAWQIARDADHPEARIVMDPFHILRGGGSLEEIPMVPGNRVAIWHWNDVPKTPPISQQTDGDRIMPGDGVGPLRNIEKLIIESGYEGYVSLELFNDRWWKENPAKTVKIGMEKMQLFFNAPTD